MAAAAGPRAPSGPYDAITDVAGLLVGHAADPVAPRGVTVVLAPQGAVAGVDVRGAAPGTRETDLLDPINLVERAHAVCLVGGSAFGLAAADGVVRWLAARGHGFPTAHGPVPIVPAAVLYDLGLGDPAVLPTAAWGERACDAARGGPVDSGSVGAGRGCTTGKLPGGLPLRGGLGTASVVLGGGITVAALVAVNAAGDVADPVTGRLYAEGADGPAFDPTGDAPGREAPFGASPITSTTIGVVATDAPFAKREAAQVARMAHDGLARAVRPAHTMLDGDAFFALATGAAPAPPHVAPALLLSAVGAAAADAVVRAVARAVRSADPLPGWPAYREWVARL
jgi:L-aminopeptidase/D-esterase-like protein